MQFSANHTALVDALGWVAKSLPARPAVPVLAAVKLSVTGNVLTLSAFDYDQSAVATVEVLSNRDGTVLVSGRLLADIARALPKDDVRFTVEGNKLLIQSKASKFSLQIMPDHDYPALPENPPTLGSVDANAFGEAVRKVVPAAGRDDMLPVLTSVNMKFDPATGAVTMAATDRFRLAIAKVAFDTDGDTTGEPISILVPARVIDLWAKSLAGRDGGRFTLGAGGENLNVFSIQAGDRSATVRLLDGSYPKVEALIPKDYNAESVLNSADLLAAVKRVALVAQGTATPAKVAFTREGVDVSATGDDEANEFLDAEHVGAESTMGFNVAYLQDGLNAMGGGDLRVSLVAPTKPVVFQPKDGEDFTYLLMPMRG